MLQYLIEIVGRSPIIMHSSAGLLTGTPISREIAEIAAKKGKNRTVTDDARLAELETRRSIWWSDRKEAPVIPAGAIRSCIETAARTLKQGPLVRRGMVVNDDATFVYDADRYGRTLEELGRNCQFQNPVVVSRARIIRTRALFEDWSAKFELAVDKSLIDAIHLADWLEIAGARIGLGDWRPDKSGFYGRFGLVSITDAATGEPALPSGSL